MRSQGGPLPLVPCSGCLVLSIMDILAPFSSQAKTISQVNTDCNITEKSYVQEFIIFIDIFFCRVFLGLHYLYNRKTGSSRSVRTSEIISMSLLKIKTLIPPDQPYITMDYIRKRTYVINRTSVCANLAIIFSRACLLKWTS